jgi:hypothetical protein
VGRLGLEPRTHGLKEDRCTAPSALPAPMFREYARKVHTAHSRRRNPFHEPFHGTRAPYAAVSVTKRSQFTVSWPVRRRAGPRVLRQSSGDQAGEQGPVVLGQVA